MNELLKLAKNNNFKIATGNISVLNEIKAELLKKAESGGIHPMLVDLLINRDYYTDIKLPNPKSIIAVAIPCADIRGHLI